MIHPFKLFGVLATPLHLPLLGLALVLFAATALGPLLRAAPKPMPVPAIVDTVSPFGSGAALRNLLF